MKEKDIFENKALDDIIGCLGDFNSKDEICVKHCALNIRCIIEKQEMKDLQFFEDVYYYDDSLNLRLQ